MIRPVGAALAARLAACVALGLAPGVARADLPELKSRGSLRVLAAADEDPAWFSPRAGESPGFEREALEGFARLHKLRLEVVPVVRWEQAIPMLRRGDGDLVAGMSATPERRQHVEFSGELLPARSIVVTRRPRAPLRSLAELRAARVAVVPHTSWAAALDAASVPASRTLRVPDVSSAVEALGAGHADAVVTGVVDFLLQRRKHPELEAGLALGEPHSSAWAVSPGSPQLRRALDAYLGELRRGPNWSRLLVKYFGDDAPAILGREPLR